MSLRGAEGGQSVRGATWQSHSSTIANLRRDCRATLAMTYLYSMRPMLSYLRKFSVRNLFFIERNYASDIIDHFLALHFVEYPVRVFLVL